MGRGPRRCLECAMARTRSVTRRVFDASMAGRFPELDALAGVARVRNGEDLVFEEQFFDTEDFRLGSRGIVLYRRTGGPDEGWHLELPDGRSAIEPAGTHSSPPPSLTDGLQFHLRGRTLLRSADVTVVRRVSLLLADDGGELAEAADEHHRAEPLITDGAPRAWRLWDFEVREPGAKKLFKELDRTFGMAGAQPGGRSNSLQTLAASIPAAGRVVAADPAGKGGKAQRALFDYVREQRSRWEDLDPQVRVAAPDSVHQLRIAVRRLRSALSAFRRDLDPEAGKELRDELQWLGRVLGRVRDTEVMRERLRGRLAAEPPELVLGSVSRSFEESLGAEFAEGSRELAQAMISERYFRLLDALDEFLASAEELGNEAWKTKASVSGVVRRDVKRLREAVLAAAKAEGTDQHDVALHTVRKAAKRLRYVAEAAVPFGRKKAARLGRRAQKIQKTLGEHQDSIVTADLVRRLGVEAYGRGENAFTYGRLHAKELQFAQEAEEKFDRQLRKLPSKLGRVR